MKILKISSTKLLTNVKAKLDQYGMIVTEISPTPLSAFTALRIGREADRTMPDIIMVNRQKDAIAAIAAKKIAENHNYKIIYVVKANSPIPKAIHKQVMEGVDCWLFESERLFNLADDNLHNKTLLPPVPIVASNISVPDITVNPPIIAWIGPITDTERLKRILDKVDELDGSFVFRISGAGVARDVMPAVRHARTLRHADKVIWVGEEYNKAKEIDLCTAAVKTNLDTTPIEAEIMQTGRRVLDIDQIDNFISSPSTFDKPEEYNPEKYLMHLRQALLK